MKPLLWAELPHDELRARRDDDALEVALLPVGGASPHGAHLPTGTDTILVETLCHAVSAQTGFCVLPTLPFGVAARAHSVAIAPATLALLVQDVMQSALDFGVKRIVILSANAENLPAIESALQTLRARHPHFMGVAKPLWDATPQTRDAWHQETNAPHAGLAETALMQYLAPALVLATPPAEPPKPEPIFPANCAQTNGSPQAATPELGAQLFEALVVGWTRFVKRASVENAQAPTREIVAAPEPQNGYAANALFRAPGSDLS